MRKIILALCISIALPLISTLSTYAAVYPGLVIVDRTEDNLVVGTDPCGNIWNFPDTAGDWQEGDFAAVIFYDNETPIIYDDIILSSRYVGYIELVSSN